MDNGIAILETSIEEKTLYEIIHQYRILHSDKPLWYLVEDIQQQAMIYANITEQLKSGKTDSDIRLRFETDLELVRGVPNPHALMDWALNKLKKYRRAFLDLVSEYGVELLKELSFSAGLTATLGAELGFPQITVSVGVEYTVGAQT